MTPVVTSRVRRPVRRARQGPRAAGAVPARNLRRYVRAALLGGAAVWAAGAAPALAQEGTTTSTPAPVTPPPATPPQASPPTAPPPSRPAVEEPLATAPTARRAWVARVLLPTVARSQPRRGARVVRRVSPYGPYDRDPQSLLVLESRGTPSGSWYRVLLPARPNGTSGWVAASDVQVSATAYRVRIDLGDRRLELLRAGRRVRTWSVGVGTAANPTPTGLFAVSEIVPQTPASGFFGPFIVTLTAHSTRLSDFDGGQGQVAVHGTSLPGLLGGAVSHGCVRMRNDAITVVARLVPRGAPVEVVP